MEQLEEPDDTPIRLPAFRLYGIFEHDDFADNLPLGVGTEPEDPPIFDEAA